MTKTMCCFSNNVRHLVFLLTALCSSVLFANILLFNATVMHNSKEFYPGISEEKPVSSEPLVRVGREANDALNKNGSREETLNDQWQSSNSILDEDENILDVNETVTQQIANELLENTDNKDEEINEVDEEPTHKEEPTMNTKDPEKDDVNPAKGSHEIAPSERTSSKNTEADSESFIESRPTQNIIEPIHSDKIERMETAIEHADSPTEDSTNEGGDGKTVSKAGVNAPSLEKKISLVLVWVAPGIGTFLGAVPSIYLLRAIGARKLFTACLLVSSIATFCLAFLLDTEWNQFAIAGLRCLQGVAFASVFPVVGSMTTNWGTVKEQFLFIAWSIFFIEFAPLLSWPLSALCISYDYKLPYIWQASGTMILALVWAIFFRNGPEFHPWVNGLESNRIVTGKIWFINHRFREERQLHQFMKSGPVWAVWIGAFGYLCAICLLSQFLPFYFYSIMNEQKTDAIISAALPFLAVYLMMWLHGLWTLISGRCNNRLSVVLCDTIPLLFSAFGFIALAVLPMNSLGVFRAVIAFSMLLVCCSMSVYGFGRSAVLVGRFLMQHIVADLQIFMGLAMMLTSTIVLLIVNNNSPHEWRLVFVITAALLVISGTVFAFLGSGEAEKWSKQSCNPSSDRRMISIHEIDDLNDECGIIEMRPLNQLTAYD